MQYINTLSFERGAAHIIPRSSEREAKFLKFLGRTLEKTGFSAILYHN